MMIPKGYRVCIRCKGRKKLYKTGGGWTFENTGGVLTSCPMCNEAGTIPLLENAIEESKKVLEINSKGSSNAKKESRRTAEA